MEMRTIRGFRAYRHPRPNRLRRSRDQAARTQVQELQGLKPAFFPTTYGPTNVVP